MIRKRDKKGLSAIDIPYVLGGLKKGGAELPVKLTVDITPELKKTVLGFAALFAGSIVIVGIVKAVSK